MDRVRLEIECDVNEKGRIVRAAVVPENGPYALETYGLFVKTFLPIAAAAKAQVLLAALDKDMPLKAER